MGMRGSLFIHSFIHSAFHKYILNMYSGPVSATSDGNSVVNRTWVLLASSSGLAGSMVRQGKLGHGSQLGLGPRRDG